MREKQMQITDRVMSILSDNDVKFKVAGGAPRDWYLGNTAKDVDIFYEKSSVKCNFKTPMAYSKKIDGLIHCFTTNQGYYLNEMLKKELSAKEFDEIIPSGGYDLNPDINAVYDTIIDGVNFQFIEVFELDNLIKNFSHSISMIEYSGNEGFKPSKLFIASIWNKVIIETGEVYSNGESYKQRLQEKFPDYKFINKQEAFDLLL